MICKRKLVNLSLTSALFIVLLAAFSSASAQESHSQSVTMEITGDVLMLSEVGGIISENGDTVQIQMVMPPEHRPKEYKDVDLEAGDIIKMANGKKIKSVSDLSELYDNLGIGETLKFGIYRGKRMMMTSLVKGDSENMPVQMMMVTDDDGMSSGDGEVMGELINAGLAVNFDGAKLIVVALLDGIETSFDGPKPRVDDIILTVNKVKMDNIDNLGTALEGVKLGDKITLSILRGEEKLITSYIKSENKERPMIQRKTMTKGN